MIIDTSGAFSGVVEYYETGMKADRGFTRDELDNRITLLGEIKHLDRILEENRCENVENNYLHISLSFEEDDIDEDTLQQIANEAKEFFLAGDKNEAFYCYAEAHMPKIKEFFTHDGEIVQRKPHIHMVIPHANLITGEREELLGYVNNQYTIKQIDNFQEYINTKYNLESPKSAEHIRSKPTTREDIINRYRPTSREKELEAKNKIYQYVMANPDIDSVDKLAERLGRDLSITAKVRKPNNPNRPSYVYIDYKNGEGRGINLNYPVFHDDFLKNREMNIAKDFEAKNSIPIEQRIEKLEKWKAWDSLTTRFVNTPLLRKNFYNWTKEEQEEFINKSLKRDQKGEEIKVEKPVFQPKYEKKQGINTIPNLANINTIEDIANVRRENLRGKQSDDNLPSMRESGKNGNRRTGRAQWRNSHSGENLLPDNSRLHMGRKSPNKVVELLLTSNRRGFNDGARSEISEQFESETGSGGGIFKNERAELKGGAESTTQNWKQIIDGTDIDRLLDYCTHYYGIDRKKYGAIKNKTGANRVKSKNRMYSASDFLQKELNLNWNQVKHILNELNTDKTRQYPPTFTKENAKMWQKFHKTRNSRNPAWTNYQNDRQRIYNDFKFKYDKKLSYKENQARKEKLAFDRKVALELAEYRFKREKFNATIANFHAYKQMQENKAIREERIEKRRETIEKERDLTVEERFKKQVEAWQGKLQESLQDPHMVRKKYD